MPSAPVEEKGYKNMINLPDWQNIHNIIIKCENRLKNRRIILPCRLPFHWRTGTLCTIRLKTAHYIQVASGIPISLLINAEIGYKPYSGLNPRNLDE